ncbi:MobA/MobL family protein, partial [Acinetobacter baumannii]
TDIKDLRQRWADLCNSHLEKHQIDSRIDMRSYKEQGVEKAPEKKLLPSQAKDPEIREALQQSRIAYKELEQLDLGDPKK